MGSNLEDTVEDWLGTGFKITEITWRIEGAPSQCAARERVGPFPALLPLHLTAVPSRMFPLMGWSYHDCLYGHAVSQNWASLQLTPNSTRNTKICSQPAQVLMKHCNCHYYSELSSFCYWNCSLKKKNQYRGKGKREKAWGWVILEDHLGRGRFGYCVVIR